MRRGAIVGSPCRAACYVLAVGRTVSVAVGSLLVLVSTAAEAAPSDQAAAEALFQEGKALFDKGTYAQACPKFEESYRLDPAGGTLFALALCREAEGKLASAWAHFSAVAASKGARADRVATARSKVAELEPRVPRVVIVVPDAARVPGLSVKRDDTELGASSWGASLPLDPGEHVVVASAPGYATQRESLTLGPGDRREVRIGLRAAPASESSDAASPALRKPAPVAASSSSPLRVGGYVALGLGAVGLGVGAYFGFKARSHARDANDRCPDVACNDDAAFAAVDDGRSAARVANVATGVGLAFAVTGVVLVLTAPKGTSAGALVVSPGVAAGGGAVRLTREF